MTKTLNYGDRFAAVFPNDADEDAAPGVKQAAEFAVLRGDNGPALVMVREFIRAFPEYTRPVIEQGETFVAEGVAFMVRQEEVFLSIDRIRADGTYVDREFAEKRER